MDAMITTMKHKDRMFEIDIVALLLSPASDAFVVCDGALLEVLRPGALIDVELGVASDSSSEQDSSKDSSSPTEFVTVIGSQEKPESSDDSAITISVIAIVTVMVLVIVTVSVGSQSCLGWKDLALGWVVVVGGGLYESEQSVSSSSVAFTLLVAVTGKQVNSGASSGSVVSVAYCVVVVVTVVTVVSGGQLVS